MTYLQFLTVFVIVPAAGLFALGLYQVSLGHEGRSFFRWHWRGVLVLAGIAFVWTTPWDNYIVAHGVWTYGPDRVLATVGYVPVEEYAFFIFMPFYNGSLFVCLAEALGGIQHEPFGKQRGSRLAAFMIGGSILAAAFLLFRYGQQFLYLSTTLLWFVPPLMVQWMYDAKCLLANARLILLATLYPTFLLCVADFYAISQGIWSISDPTRTGFDLFGLPVEEVFFFFIVSLLLAQGMVLWHRLRYS